MRVLLFLPSSHNAIDILSQALYLNNHENEIIFLSTSPRGHIHKALEYQGIMCDSLNIPKLSSLNYLKAIFSISDFITKNKIEVIISNNLQGNFIASLAQLFYRKRTILARHHSDYITNGSSRNAKIQQRIVNLFGKEFIAISDIVKNQMIKEGINGDDIHRINLGFDFSLFPSPNEYIVNQLIERFRKSFKICVIARLIPLKRHLLLFEAIKKLNDQGENVVLWVIGDGPIRNQLESWVKNYSLENIIYFTGYIEGSHNYLNAADLLVHTSESEASSHVIREAAILETPVLVCKEVGDFEDYILDNVSGYFVEKNIDSISLSKKIEKIILEKENLHQTISPLKKAVIERFSIDKNGEDLLKLLNNE